LAAAEINAAMLRPSWLPEKPIVVQREHGTTRVSSYGSSFYECVTDTGTITLASGFEAIV
jgi:hypothetical protein